MADIELLSPEYRRQLERAVVEARDVAEVGARVALEALAVHHHEPYKHMDAAQRTLRRRLRAHARQLGDRLDTRSGGHGIDHLVHECAYEHWHGMLFARFLAENHLLIEPEMGVAITLDECEELAKEEGVAKWTLAARFAQRMLPQVFRPDHPVFEVQFAREYRLKLESLVEGLPPDVFTATDSVGWVYQFWQTKKKDEVNRSEIKIGADELPSVTQLFTEDYMVDFLLDNTLGAWHAGKILDVNPSLAESAKSEDELRKAVKLPDCPWNYVRFIKDKDGKWSPAASTFERWPKTAKELKCLDPCMGSGHFVVAMFERLVAIRMAEEKLDEVAAVAAVIRENLFGLEIDPRCAQIAAFNLALVAWRRVGHGTLPAMNLACSGLAPNTHETEWLEIADDNQKLQNGMARLHRLFQGAPVLGSLINPRAGEGDLLEAGFHELKPLLEKALAQEANNDAAHEMAVTARGLAKAAEILAGQFTLVATNVPYLGRGKQVAMLQKFCDEHHSEAKADLSTCFVERCIKFTGPNLTIAVVTPQNWLFLATYRAFRKLVTRDRSWKLVTRLGSNAFQDMNWWHATTALIILSSDAPTTGHIVRGLDVSTHKDQAHKAILLRGGTVDGDSAIPQSGAQATIGADPDTRIILRGPEVADKLCDFAVPHTGMQTGDNDHYSFAFWELPQRTEEWEFFHRTSERTSYYSGRFQILRWENGNGSLAGEPGRRIAGLNCLGRAGVLVHRMNQLPVTIYTGEIFDQNGAVILTNNVKDLTAVWCYLSSNSYRHEVRCLDTKTGVTPKTLAAVPFDAAHWRKLAAEKYSHGLPKSFSGDATQWLFNGQPKCSDEPLHVTVARLLGYEWPRQTGSSFPDCPALDPDDLAKNVDADGIVCIPSVRGERPAHERLLQFLQAAWGDDWKDSVLAKLLADAGGSRLDDWLRDRFFDAHCKLFHHRPFIWHVWDGRKRDGFNALVNYHKLAEGDGKGRRLLESLTYSYLGDWIARQQDGVKRGEGGAEDRLAAALDLQKRLVAILEGEPPFDIFVRWKPIEEQPIGWEPDINDGVRRNIRPFIAQDIHGGKKGAGILRARPNIHWKKDRGKERVRDQAQFPWFWQNGKFTGERVNDVHLTIAEKRASRDQAKGQT